MRLRRTILFLLAACLAATAIVIAAGLSAGGSTWQGPGPGRPEASVEGGSVRSSAAGRDADRERGPLGAPPGAPPGEGKRRALSEGASVVGFVHGRATQSDGSPMPGVRIWLDWQRQESLLWQDGALVHLGETRTGKDGWYRFPLPPWIADEHLPDAEVVVRFQPPPELGFVEIEEVEVERGRDGILRVRADGEISRPEDWTELEVIVRSADGVPVSGAEIHCLDDRHWMSSEAGTDGRDWFWMLSGRELHWVQAWHPDFGRSQVVAWPSGSVELVLQERRASLRGQLRFAGGAPAAGVELYFVCQDDGETDFGVGDHVSLVQLRTRADGSFLAHGVVPGTWMVRCDYLDPIDPGPELILSAKVAMTAEQLPLTRHDEPPLPSERRHPVPGAPLQLALTWTRVRLEFEGLSPSDDRTLHVHVWEAKEALQHSLGRLDGLAGRGPRPEVFEDFSGYQEDLDLVGGVAELWLQPGDAFYWELEADDGIAEESAQSREIGGGRPRRGWVAVPGGLATDLTRRIVVQRAR